MSRSARCAVFVAVLAFHGLAVVFLARNTAKRIVTLGEDVVRTDISVPVPAPRPEPEEEPPTTRAQVREAQTAHARPEPITVEPADEEAAPWIDWQASAERAAQSVTQPSPYRQFGRPDVMPRGPVRSPSTGRVIGETYTDDVTGEVRRWVSEDCYQVVKNAPAAGVQDDFARKLPSRVMCSLKSRKPRGDLFKDLPAYKRHLLPESRDR